MSNTVPTEQAEPLGTVQYEPPRVETVTSILGEMKRPILDGPNSGGGRRRRGTLGS